MRSPRPRGPVSTVVLGRLHAGRPGPLPAAQTQLLADAVDEVADPLRDGDLQLALASCYELHYRGFEDVDDALEWDVGTVAVTSLLEAVVEDALRRAVPPPGRDLGPGDVPAALRALVDADSGPELSGHLLREATAEQYRDFLAQRSIYHLKEADPHTWAIPRLSGRSKAALVEIQADEYGGGRPEAMHSALFARSMRALELDDTYGAYWDRALPETFAAVNLMTMLGLHRRHRGASAGHLAALEMTSTLPNRRYGNGLRRLGFGDPATAYFDEHVEADAVHEQVAAVDLCGSLAAAEPDLSADIVWGAACCLALDAAVGRGLLRSWGVPADDAAEQVA